MEMHIIVQGISSASTQWSSLITYQNARWVHIDYGNGIWQSFLSRIIPVIRYLSLMQALAATKPLIYLFTQPYNKCLHANEL